MFLLAWVGVAALGVVHDLATFGAARALGVPVTRRFVSVRGMRGARGMFACAFGFAVAYLVVAVLAFVHIQVRGYDTGKITQVVRAVEPGSPATGKLAPGDRFVAIDGVALSDGIAAAVNARNGAPIRVTFERDSAVQDVTIEPAKIDGRWRLGITLWADAVRRSDISVSLSAAWRYPIMADVFAAQQLWAALSAKEPTDPGGPTRIVDRVPESSALLELHALVELAARALVVLLLVDVIRIALCLRRPSGT